MSLAVLDVLIEQVSRATGPDRELDHLIYAELDNRDVIWDRHKMLARSRVPPYDTCWLGTIDPGTVQRNFSGMSGFKPPIPNHTSSLDDALLIVPKGDAVWSVSGVNAPPDDTWLPRATCRGNVAHAKTPVLALCLVALQARRQEAQERTVLERTEG